MVGLEEGQVSFVWRRKYRLHFPLRCEGHQPKLIHQILKLVMFFVFCFVIFYLYTVPLLIFLLTFSDEMLLGV